MKTMTGWNSRKMKDEGENENTDELKGKVEMGETMKPRIKIMRMKMKRERGQQRR